MEEPASIVCFPNIQPGALPTTFARGGFAKDHVAVMKEQQEGILASFTKMDLEKEHSEWDNFWDALPAHEQSVQDALLFALPQKNKSDKVGKVHQMSLPIDDGIRKVDFVTHAQFKNSERLKQLKQTAAAACKRLQQGQFVLLDIQLNNNTAGYVYPFRWFMGEIVEDVSTLPEVDDATFQVQIYRPSTVTSLTSKFVPWKGSDIYNKLWKEQVS